MNQIMESLKNNSPLTGYLSGVRRMQEEEKQLTKYSQKNLSEIRKIEIREMQPQELELAMSWAVDEGWNPGKHDHLAYYQQDPAGFLVLHLSGQPIGSISMVRHSNTFAFIGLFIVLPEYRSQGFGKMLWNEALKRLETFSSVGLYAVPQQISRYRKSGFFDRYGVSHLELPELSSAGSSSPNSCLEGINENNLDLLSESDKVNWGSSRASFFNTLFTKKGDECYGFLSFDQETGAVNGYGIARPCQEGFRVGPLYAKSFECAKNLVDQLLSCLDQGTKVIFDVPERNEFSAMFAEYFNLNLVNEACTQAMFKGGETETRTNICYGLLSLEIG